MIETFRFGVEIEVLLSLRTQANVDLEGLDLEAFAECLIEKLKAVNSRDFRHGRPEVHNDVNGIYEGDERHEWTFTDDVTIRPDHDRQWPLEIVSPILTYDEDGEWRCKVQNLFIYVRTMCRIEANSSCGLHVHVSPPAGTPWDLNSLQCICRGILYFEGAINALLPASRRDNEYAASNISANPRLAGMDFGARMTAIENCQNRVEIADLMNDNGNRYYSWNFTNLYYGGKSTVEFRQAPGVSTETQCLQWIEFVVSFASSSLRVSDAQQLSRFSRDVRGLRDFFQEFDIPGRDQAVLRTLFRGKSGFIAPAPVRTLTTQETEIYRLKELQANSRNLMMKKLRDA